MSENLDLVRSIYERVERGDYGKTDWANPEIDYVVLSEIEPHMSTGLTAMAEHMRTLFADLDDFRQEAEEYREIDRQRVLVLARWSGRGKKSGIAVSQQCAEVFEIQDGTVNKLTVYSDRDEAFSDLGLEE